VLLEIALDSVFGTEPYPHQLQALKLFETLTIIMEARDGLLIDCL
jgi:hypothetical protein